MLEDGIERRFHQKVRKAGGASFKFAPLVRGNPDRIVLLPGGRIYLVELKTETGALRPDQIIWHEKAAALGTQVVVLAGTKEVDEWLAEVCSDQSDH